MKTPTVVPLAIQAFTLPESMKGDRDIGQSDVRQSRLAAERALDEVLAESFPASDPPSWTLGVVRPDPVGRAPYNTGREQKLMQAPQPASAAVGVFDVARPLRGERTLIDALISLAAACGIVLLVPLAILLVGVPIALLVRGLIEAFSWLLAFVVP